MKTTILALLLVVIITVPLETIAQVKKELVICQFGGVAEKALKESMFDPFEKETGIKVIPVTRPNAAKIKAMVEAKNVEWDVVLGASPIFGTCLREGLLEKIDYKYFDRKTLDEMYPEAKKEYGVGTFTFSIVMAWDKGAFPKNPPKSWAEFWDVKKFPGPRCLHTMTDCGCNWEFALQAAGVPLDKLYDRMWPPDFPHMETVWRKYNEIKPHIVKFWREGAEPTQLLTDKSVVLTSVYNGRVQALVEQGAPVDYTFNGGMLYLEYMMIPKGAPNYDNACKFLAFQSRAIPQAEHGKRLAYGPINSKAFDHMPPERVRIMPSSPENKKVQFIENEEWYKKHTTMMIERWQNWLVK